MLTLSSAIRRRVINLLASGIDISASQNTTSVESATVLLGTHECSVGLRSFRFAVDSNPKVEFSLWD
jgi:hypothetical protein